MEPTTRWLESTMDALAAVQRLDLIDRPWDFSRMARAVCVRRRSPTTILSDTFITGLRSRSIVRQFVSVFWLSAVAAMGVALSSVNDSFVQFVAAQAVSPAGEADGYGLVGALLFVFTWSGIAHVDHAVFTGFRTSTQTPEPRGEWIGVWSTLQLAAVVVIPAGLDVIIVDPVYVAVAISTWTSAVVGLGATILAVVGVVIAELRATNVRQRLARHVKRSAAIVVVAVTVRAARSRVGRSLWVAE